VKHTGNSKPKIYKFQGVSCLRKKCAPFFVLITFIIYHTRPLCPRILRWQDLDESQRSDNDGEEDDLQQVGHELRLATDALAAGGEAGETLNLLREDAFYHLTLTPNTLTGWLARGIDG
jgi:hypothetical protein